ncbi:unnamed protein product [Sympodiomycopsis kandeliae]
MAKFAYPGDEDYARWNQPVGVDIQHLPAAIDPPQGLTITGHYVDLVPIGDAELKDLWENVGTPGEDHDRLWTYMLDGPWKGYDYDSFAKEMKHFLHVLHGHEVFYAIKPKLDFKTGATIPESSRKVIGRFSLIRTDLPNKSTEIGHVIFSPTIQKTPYTTESIFLLQQHVFENLHFKRLEWKCHEHNIPSKNAAKRYGFTFEGIFRNHYIVKGRSRNTAWFSITDEEWPTVKKGFQQWLNKDNFDQQGNQKKSLLQIREALSQ